MSNLRLFQKIVTSGAIATTAALGTFVAKVQAASFTLPIEAAAKATGIDALRDRYGLDGTGITIGVISDSFNTSPISFDSSGKVDNYTTNISSGYLPSDVQILEDFPDPDPTVIAPDDPIDEGRSLLQVIHAVAPKAKLAFHTGRGSTDNLAQAIQSLAAAGADIIVNDVSFVPQDTPDAPSDLLDLEPPNGPINQAIDKVFNQGVSFFSAGGNNFSLGIPIYGHSNNPNALTSGAVYYGNAESYTNQTFGVVVKQGEVEPFSSEGNPDSLKPDVVAPDGLPISFNLGGGARPYEDDPRFFSFFGTSASAPFTGAAAALLLQAKPNATPTDLYNALRNTAESPFSGYDSRLGFGLIRADRAVLALGVPPKTIPEPSAAPALLYISVLIAGLLSVKYTRRQFNHS
jgi:Subtilase family